MTNLEKDPAAKDADIVLDARSYDRYVVPPSLLCLAHLHRLTRSRPRWTGSAPEPRPSLSSGHMPHSLSLPFNALLAPPSPPHKTWTTFAAAPALREAVLTALAGRAPGAWAEMGNEERKAAERRWEEVKSGKREVTWTCGSGMTACVGVLGMRILAEAEADGPVDVLPRIYDEVGSEREGSAYVCGGLIPAHHAELDGLRDAPREQDCQGGHVAGREGMRRMR